jgi:ABC-2 type transport system permease protein
MGAVLPATRLRRDHGPLLLALAWKNVRLRYKSSLLGFFWTLLNPLLFLLIFLLIFSQAFPQVPNYPVFALTGLVFWTFFSTVSGHMLGALVENANVLKSLAVPPLAFPVGQLMAGLFNLALSFVPLAFILAWFGWRPGPVHLLILPATVLFTGFLFGIGLGLCALNVYFRDIGLLWSALLPAFFYLTPIAYPPDLVPERLRWVAELNPLYHFIALVRTIIVEGNPPGAEAWILATILAAVAVSVGMTVHHLLRRGYIANY